MTEKNTNHAYKKQKDYPHDISLSPNQPYEEGHTYVAYKANRGITKSRHRTESSEASHDYNYEQCATLLSDETSNKHKVVADADVSTIS